MKNDVTLVDFNEYFKALHQGNEPYDWQMRLAQKAAAGEWPAFIDLPTGSGKTACIDVAIFALARQAALPINKRTAPRRTFFCVNRRVIVDAAYQRAMRIAQAIWAAERNGGESDAVLKRVAEGLRGISGIEDRNIPPLDVLELRGGIYRDNRWARSLTQPTIVCTTIDQLGSRLLFRGYGVSPEAAPIQAALIAYDSLVLLDEAHISPSFLQTLQRVERYLDPSKWAQQNIGVPRVKVVAMTATPPEGATGNHVIQLEDQDRRNEGLHHRLACPKPAVLKGVKNVVEAAVQTAHELSQGPTVAVGIVVNRVATAKEVYNKLREQHPEAIVELVIGSMRPVDRDQQAERLQGLVGPCRPAVTERTSFVVATQCLEVGADYDFDILITECASLDALRQRFGRLNRGGRRDSEGRYVDAQAVILIDERQIKADDKLDDTKPIDPVYGNALSRTWNWLWEHAQEISETKQPIEENGRSNNRKAKRVTNVAVVRSFDFGIAAFTGLLEKLGHKSQIPGALLSPSSHLDAPVMLPAYIDLWCQTNPQPTPDPDVSLFIHGQQEVARDVQVCWRADLKDQYLKPESWPDVVALLPPTSAECMSVPISRLRGWLLARPDVIGDQSDLLVTSQKDDGEKEQARTPFVLWKGSKASTLSRSVSDLYPGCTVVLPASAEGWEDLGHIPESLTPEDELQSESSEGGDGELTSGERRIPPAGCVSGIDVAEAAYLQARGRAALRIHPALKPLVEKYPGANRILERLADVQSPPSKAEIEGLARSVMCEVLDDCSNEAPNVRWEFYPDLRGVVITTRQRRNRSPGWYLRPLDDGEDQPSRTFGDEPVPLSSHTAHVVRETAEILKALPIAVISEALTVSAELHDWGKADERFQAYLRRSDRSDAWLYAGISSTFLAKSDGVPQTRAENRAARDRAGLPDGFRHEMLSVQLAEKSDRLPDDPAQQELVLHLIAAHHGYARPFAPVVVDDDPPEVSVGDVMLTREDRLKVPPHRLDSCIAERFWKLTLRYGWWGLAYLEALLRLADQVASAKEDSRQYKDQIQGTETLEMTAAEVVR